ncbi:hypothetical protein PN36_31025 [Candidatus Thiomargarita nelsonii]|uniref:Sel1 repeat family protein n=1 Tax=Candidatus Thiomargarita nelsonii TaxID=1003181 RepID=A0A4E0RMY9_9GAMM|nr:hypothetical protein PN36_31025 [Candidatus Thiomargarita nelsonii]
MKVSEEKLKEKQEEIFYQEKLAEKGDAEAQNIVAARLAKGYFVEKNEQGAFYWYCQAVKQGYIYAKWNAGIMLLNGEGGLQKNYKLAMMLIEDAANSGESDACNFLSFCYLNEKYGKEKNMDLSEQWKKISKCWEKPKYFGDPVDLETYGIEIRKPVIRFLTK